MCSLQMSSWVYCLATPTVTAAPAMRIIYPQLRVETTLPENSQKKKKNKSMEDRKTLFKKSQTKITFLFCFLQGVDRGVHPFLVQLRNGQGDALPGVLAAPIGPKVRSNERISVNSDTVFLYKFQLALMKLFTSLPGIRESLYSDSAFMRVRIRILIIAKKSNYSGFSKIVW